MSRISEKASEFKQISQSAVERVVKLTTQISEIPAPTYDEMKRASFVAEQFNRRGLEAQIDDIGNVIARRKGNGNKKTFMIAAHTDTVFPAGTDISVTRNGDTLQGPSIGDNSLGVGEMLTLVDLLNETNVETPGDLLLIANVGEEGLGNLRGMRAVTDAFEDELGGVIALEGHNLGRVTNGGVGSHRIRVTVTGPGGHSWGAFGQPSAIHALGEIIHGIAHLDVSSDPKTTYNVGVIDGGVSVNTIAPKASAIVDMRSVSADSLAELVERVEKLIADQNTDQISTTVEVLGERPAGHTPVDTTIVKTSMEILRSLGYEPVNDASSTDANVPISRGIPAVCVGITTGSGAHRNEEMINISPIAQGLQQLLHLVDLFPVDSEKA